MQSTHVRCRPLVVAALLSLPPHAAFAQAGGLALDTFDPAPAGDRFFSVPSPQTQGHLIPRATAVFDYAHEPFVVSDGLSTGAVVAQQGFLHLGASLSISNYMLIYANLPIALWQNGENPTVGDIAFTSPDGAQVGDLRTGARIRVVGTKEEPFQVSFGTSIYFPTAPVPSFAGDGGFRVAPEVVAGGVVSRFLWSAALRPMFRTSNNPMTLHHGAGIGYMVVEDRLQLGLEYMGITPLQDGFLTVAEGKTIRRGLLSNLEVHLAVRGRIVSGLWAGFAAGPGLTDALGTPQFRGIAMVGWMGPPKK